MKNFKDLVKESEVITEGQKWSFDKSNQSMSGEPTISTEVDIDGIGMVITLGHVSVDNEWFVEVNGYDEDMEEVSLSDYEENGFENLGGEGVSFGSVRAKDCIEAIEKTFSVKVDRKAFSELATYAALNI